MLSQTRLLAPQKVWQLLLSCLLLALFGGNCQTTLADRPWATEMQAFEAADREASFKPGGIVFVGSSSIRMWDLKKSFPELVGTAINRGFGGSQIKHSIAELPLLVLSHQPRTVIFYAGDNDIAAGVSPQTVEVDFNKFVAGIHSELPKTKIYFLPIKPSTSRWHLVDEILDTNQRIQEICSKDERLVYILTWEPMLDAEGKPRKELLQEDGLHMTEAGYQIWSDLLREAGATK